MQSTQSSGATTIRVLVADDTRIHTQLLADFVDRGFEIVFNYPPNTQHETPWGSFNINDGIITARNR